jgi:hypothetical protein
MADVSAETEKTRAEVAEYLREFADELSPQGERSADADRQERSQIGEDRSQVGEDRSDTEGSRSDDGKVTVIAGNESATIVPPETLSFGVEVDAEDSLLGGPTGERGVVFSLSWSSEDVETSDDLDVE